jgi:hypothetical protein
MFFETLVPTYQTTGTRRLQSLPEVEMLRFPQLLILSYWTTGGTNLQGYYEG